MPQLCRSFVVPDLLPELPALLPAEFASFEEPVQLSVRKASVEAGLVKGLFQLEEAIERSVSRLCSVVGFSDHDELKGERLIADAERAVTGSSSAQSPDRSGRAYQR